MGSIILANSAEAATNSRVQTKTEMTWSSRGTELWHQRTCIGKRERELSGAEVTLQCEFIVLLENAVTLGATILCLKVDSFFERTPGIRHGQFSEGPPMVSIVGRRRPDTTFVTEASGTQTYSRFTYATIEKKVRCCVCGGKTQGRRKAQGNAAAIQPLETPRRETQETSLEQEDLQNEHVPAGVPEDARPCLLSGNMATSMCTKRVDLDHRWH